MAGRRGQARRHAASGVPRNGGPAAARNTGLAGVTSELVAFCDSDCVPEAGWIERLAAHLADPAVAVAAPRIRPVPGGRSWADRYSAAGSSLDMGGQEGRVAPGTRLSYVPTAALLARRARAAVGRGAGRVRPGAAPGRGR